MNKDPQEILAIDRDKINQALALVLDELPSSCRNVAAHIINSGGKRMRPMLTVLCARIYGYDANDIYRLGCSMELLHAATLLHDDVLDNAITRRGEECAHMKYGRTRAILSGDAMLALGNSIVASYGIPALSQCYSQATALTAAGEITEMEALGRPDLSQEEYIAIARGKTGYLIGFACALGAIMAQATSAEINLASTFGQNLGIAFQIVDDALDFAPTSQTGKPTGGDLREGKLTPPLRLYRESLSDYDRTSFDAQFRNGNWSENSLSKVVSATVQFCDEARALASPYLERARASLARMPFSISTEILAWMVDHAAARSK